MQRYADAYRFGPQRMCPDGVETNVEFLQTEDAQHAWRCLDVSAQARYLSAVLRKTLPQIFAEDGAFYARHAQIVAAVRAVFEGERPGGGQE